MHLDKCLFKLNVQRNYKGVKKKLQGTPDGDGYNETFAPQGEGVDPDCYTMQIFDRSGMLIFSTRNPYDYWDGRNKYGQMCPEGVYVYKINLINLNKEDKEYIGTVTLLK